MRQSYSIEDTKKYFSAIASQIVNINLSYQINFCYDAMHQYNNHWGCTLC